MYGEIGVGKTTFARLLINQYENERKINKSQVLSPTFNIVFEYDIKEFTIKHFDLYRLKNTHDLKNIGLFENLEQETRDLYSIIHDHEIGEVPVINKSAHRHFEDCYTEETKAIVSELYNI